MFEAFKKPDGNGESRFATVSAATREALQTIEGKKQQGKLALLRRKRSEMQRAKGVGQVGLDERLIRNDYNNQVLKSGIHIMIDALEAEIQIHERAAVDYSEAFKAAESENAKLIAERDELNRRIEQLHRDHIQARSRCVQETSLADERRRELEGYLELAEALGSGQPLKLWKPRDVELQLLRQPLIEIGPGSLPGYSEGRLTEKEAEKRVAEINREFRAREQREWDEANRAFDLQISVADLRFLERHDNQDRDAA
jgi:hypothetical protein